LTFNPFTNQGVSLAPLRGSAWAPFEGSAW